LLALLLGCAVSVFGSGRFTFRLIADGTLSFAFVPLAELAGFTLVYFLGRRVLPFADAVDGFFTGNTPWLWWMLAFMSTPAFLSVSEQEQLLAPLLMTSPIPIVLSVRRDLRFFRDVLGATPGRARIDVTLQRLLSWSAATAYFLGTAITSRDFFYLFVEMRDMIVSWAAELLR
jgi:hypothetical protein